MILDNPLIGILFSSLTIAILAGLIQKVVNSHREIDKQIDKSRDEMFKIRYHSIPLSEHNLGREQYIDLQNYLIRAPIITREDIERLHTIRIEMTNNITVPEKKKLESKDLTPLSEQLEKLSKK